MNSGDLTAIQVAQYVLEVEFSKLPAAPFDPYDSLDLAFLAASVARYSDSPINSPDHFYAALTDADLTWLRMDVPVDRLIRGPGDPGIETECACRARGFVAGFVRLVAALPERDREPLRRYFWDGAVPFPVVPAVLVDHASATPFLPGPRPDGLSVYRLLDGYHRSFQLILRGCASVSAMVAMRADGTTWRGNYRHLSHYGPTGWVCRGPVPSSG